jgi:hypothetical protein
MRCVASAPSGRFGCRSRPVGASTTVAPWPVVEPMHQTDGTQAGPLTPSPVSRQPNAGRVGFGVKGALRRMAHAFTGGRPPRPLRIRLSASAERR